MSKEFDVHALKCFVAAQWYRNMGFSVIPLSGKIATVDWKPYQFSRASEQEIIEWHNTGKLKNIGIVCGDVSTDGLFKLAVIDLDGEKAVNTFKVKFPALLETHTVISGSHQGAHLYYWCAHCPPTTRTKGFELRSIGSYVVAPPSLHPDTGYEYIVPKEVEIMRLNDLENVVDFIRSLTPASTPKNEPLKAAWAAINPRLLQQIITSLKFRGYREKGRWLFGHCPFRERHNNGDNKPSFGFDTQSGRAHCFADCGCSRNGTGFISTLDLCKQLGINVNSYGGLWA